MTKLLIKLFIRNGNNPEDAVVRKKYGTFSSIVGICVNFVLALIKFMAGVLSNSVAIIADSLNNLSDAGASVITLISFKLSAKPADKDHPFGHARFEYIASMIVSFIIILVGLELLMDSAASLINPSDETKTNVDTLTFAILIASIILKIWLGLFYLKIGKTINSSVIKASATDSITDSVSTVAVLVSTIIIKYTGWQIADAIVGVAVSLVIIIAGAKILNETKNAILGEAPVDEVVKNIMQITEEYPDIIGVHDLMVHNYGPKNFIASLHAEVDGKKDIYELHDMIDNAERTIKQRLGIACTIHMDPIVTDDETVNELREFLLNTLSEEGLDFHIHDFRTVVGVTHTNLIFDIELPFESKYSDSEIIDRISGLIHSKRENVYCVISVDRS